MSLESALTTELQADATLSGLSVQVYPHIAPQAAEYPFVTYAIQSSQTERSLNKGPSGSTLTEAFVDLQVFSESVSERGQIMTRIKNLLHGFRGDLGTENLNIRETTLQSVSTFSEADLTGTDEQIYRASLILSFFYHWS